jgi:PKD repeat protein
MKKYILFTALVCITLSQKAQTVILSEDFNSYTGTTATVPSGWTFSWNSGSTSTGSYYTTTASSGPSGPNSYKFGYKTAQDSTTTITSPAFNDPDSVFFWFKGNSTDNLSFFLVMESSDGVNYDTVATINPIPNSGTFQQYKLKSSSVRVRFKYHKSVGNVAFDDFSLTGIAPIDANFSTLNHCIGDTTKFIDQSTSSKGNLTNWVWDFGDGGSSTQQNPSHAYSASGSYNVKLIVTNDSLFIDSITKTITINPLPMAGFVAGALSACGSLTTTFTDTSTISTGAISGRLWDFDNGNTATSATASQTFSAAGTYNVMLTVTSNQSCSSSVSKTVTVFANPVIDSSAVSIASANCGANDGSVTGISVIGGTTPFTYEWQNTATGGIAGTNSDLINVGKGNYQFTVKDNNNCTATSYVYYVALAGAPPAPNAPSPAKYCNGDSIADLTATGTTGTISWFEDPALTVLLGSGNTYTPSVTVGNNYFYVIETTACDGPATTVVVVVNPLPNANAGSDAAVCSGKCSQLAASGGESYSWLPATGLNNSTVSNPLACPPATTTYVVTVTDTNNCKAADSVTVTVYPNPVAGFTSSSNMLTVSFTNSSTGAVSYNWQFGDGNSSSQQNPSYTYTTAGTYNVTLVATSAAGCTDTITQSVTVTNVGIKEGDNFFSNISFYPIPSETGIITIDFGKSVAQPAEVKVYNMVGKQVYYGSIENTNTKKTEIDLSFLPAGTYFISVYNSTSSVSRRIAISR